MTLKVDKAGRVILPKPLRDRLGLRAGAGLEIHETSEGVVLKPVRRQSSLVVRNGVLMHRGTLPKGFDWNHLVEDEREEQLNVARW